METWQEQQARQDQEEIDRRVVHVLKVYEAVTAKTSGSTEQGTAALLTLAVVLGEVGDYIASSMPGSPPE